MSTRTLSFLMLLAFAVLLLTAGCTQPGPSGPSTITPAGTATTAQTRAEVKVLYTAAGQMPILLSTKQIDGYMVWQPFVAVAEKSGIGRVVLYSQDFPPAGTWKDHTCDGFVARDAFIAKYPDFTNALSALMIAATDYTQAHPDRAAEISADWLFGSANMTFGNITASSVDVEKASIPTIKFSAEPSTTWMASNDLFLQSQRDLGLVTGSLLNATPDQAKVLLYNFGPYEKAKSLISAGKPTVPASAPAKVSFGYLPSDHDAALFVAVKEWKYFQDTYGVALKPKSDAPGKVDTADLIIRNKTVAEVSFVRGDAGPQLMTLMAQDTIQFAIVGAPPTIAAIDKDTPIKILFPLQMEGSGLVIATDTPVHDWAGFIEYAGTRSAAGKPLTIAAPLKGSIQDVQLREALANSGVTVIQA